MNTPISITNGKLNGGSVIPAYGRNYASGKEAVDDFKKGKDFKLGAYSPYCSIRDFNQGAMVQVRYGKYYQEVKLVIVGE